MYKRITDQVIKQINPQLFVERALRVEKNKLYVGVREYELDGNVSVIGFGKAALDMFIPIKRKLGRHIKRSYLSIPESSHVTMTTNSNTIDTSSNSSEVVTRAARNNLPDENTLAITGDIIKYSESLSEGDLCICLISGVFRWRIRSAV